MHHLVQHLVVVGLIGVYNLLVQRRFVKHLPVVKTLHRVQHRSAEDSQEVKPLRKRNQSVNFGSETSRHQENSERSQ